MFHVCHPLENDRVGIGLNGVERLDGGQALTPQGQLLLQGDSADKDSGFQCG